VVRLVIFRSIVQEGESQQQYPAQARVFSLIPGGAEEDEEYTDVAAGNIL
jgi:hypothetical protein